jgi:hydrogenase maturation factor
MKNILSISAFIVGLIAIPIQIVMIAENNQRALFIILMCLTIPGFINAIRHLMKKVHFKVDFRIDD